MDGSEVLLLDPIPETLTFRQSDKITGFMMGYCIRTTHMRPSIGR